MIPVVDLRTGDFAVWETPQPFRVPSVTLQPAHDCDPKRRRERLMGVAGRAEPGRGLLDG